MDSVADVKSQAQQLLASWLQHEEEAAATRRRASGGSSRAGDCASGVAARSHQSCATGGTKAVVTNKRPQELRRFAGATSDAAMPRDSARSAELCGRVEERLRALQRNAGSEPSDPWCPAEADGELQTDVEVALRLLAERRLVSTSQSSASVPARGPPPTPLAAVVHRAPPAPGADPVLRMEARQQLLRANREARRRTQSADSAGNRGNAACSSGVATSDRASSSSTRDWPSTRRNKSSVAQLPATARSRSVADLSAACAEVSKQTVQLEAEAERVREEVRQEARAYEELLAAKQARDRSAAAVREADEQRRRLQLQAEKRKAASATRLVFILEAIRRRQATIARRAVMTRLREMRAAALVKFRVAVAAARAAALGRMLRAWRGAAVAERVERETHRHLEQRLSDQRNMIAATAHYDQRSVRRRWLAWRLFVRHVRDEITEQLIRDHAQRFAEAQHQDVADESNHNMASIDECQGPIARDAEVVTVGEAVATEVPASEGKPCSRTEADTTVVASGGSRQQTRARHSDVQRPKVVSDMEQRAEEMRRIREERRSRQRATDAPAADEGEAAQVQPAAARCAAVQRPKMVLNMEQRAEERRRARELRKERQALLEEERAIAEKEAEEEQRRLQEEDRRRRTQERREQEQREQLRAAQRQVDQALQRSRCLQAKEFWILHRLVDVWCALRQAALVAEERFIVAWRHDGRVRLRWSFTAWQRHHVRARAMAEVCAIARYRLALLQARRHFFRELLSALRLGLGAARAEAVAARHLVEIRTLRRRVLIPWRMLAEKAITERHCTALRHYVSQLSRKMLGWWVYGCEQERLEVAMEAHRRLLQEKVAGWLVEMDRGAECPCLSVPWWEQHGTS